MNDGASYSQATLILLILAALVVVIAGMRAAADVLVPFLLSGFIAVISAPTLFWLQRHRVPTVLALTAVLALIVGIGLAVAALVGNSLQDFSESLPQLQARLIQETTGLLDYLRRLGIDVMSGPLLEYFDPGAAMRLATRMLSGLGGVLTNAFLILLTVLFILLEAATFPEKLRAVMEHPEQSMAPMVKIVHNVQRYMEIKTVVSVLTGAAVTLWLMIVGLDYPLLWGLLAFIFNYVPNIGSIIAAVPALMLAIIQLGWGGVVLVAAGYLAINTLVGNLLEPRLMGRKLGLSTLVVFLSLVFWGWVLGPVGMLLSVPLTMTVKIALDTQEETRWVAVLLGSESSERQESEVSKSTGSVTAVLGWLRRSLLGSSKETVNRRDSS